MKTDTVLWLLPVVFMLHDFEEILMTRAWLRKNSADLRARFSGGRAAALAERFLARQEQLSTAAFALAVAVEFAALSGFTALAAELRLYSAWAGVLLIFLLHLGQWIALRRYVPTVLTSLAACAYCIPALFYAAHPLGVSAAALLPAALAALVAVLAVFILALRLAARFEGWLQRYANE